MISGNALTFRHAINVTSYRGRAFHLGTHLLKKSCAFSILTRQRALFGRAHLKKSPTEIKLFSLKKSALSLFWRGSPAHALSHRNALTFRRATNVKKKFAALLQKQIRALRIEFAGVCVYSDSIPTAAPIFWHFFFPFCKRALKRELFYRHWHPKWGGYNYMVHSLVNSLWKRALFL